MTVQPAAYAHHFIIITVKFQQKLGNWIPPVMKQAEIGTTNG